MFLIGFVAVAVLIYFGIKIKSDRLGAAMICISLIIFGLSVISLFDYYSNGKISCKPVVFSKTSVGNCYNCQGLTRQKKTDDGFECLVCHNYNMPSYFLYADIRIPDITSKTSYDPITETSFYTNQILLILDENISKRNINKVINTVGWEISVEEIMDSKTKVFPVSIPGEEKTYEELTSLCEELEEIRGVSFADIRPVVEELQIIPDTDT